MARRKSEPDNRATKEFKRSIRELRSEINRISAYSLTKDGFFKVTLRGAFVKAFEFADHSWRIKGIREDETPYFVVSTLRGICEDLIALKFLRQLKKAERDEVIHILMIMQVRKAATEQAQFFRKARPFQPVLTPPAATAADEARILRLDTIGLSSNLWRTRGKLPSTETMAITVGLRPLYDYFYRVASANVHFNPRMILRSGWGTEAGGRIGTLTPKNFSLYYLDFNRIYSVYLLSLLTRVFWRDLKLSKAFVSKVKALAAEVDNQSRWPEAITFEEMNLRSPDVFERAILKVIHDEKKEKRRRSRKKR